MWIVLGVLGGGEQARSCALIVAARKEMSSQNVHANLGPLRSECGVCYPAAVRPRLEETRHEGQYLGNRAQWWNQVPAAAYNPYRIISERTVHMLELTTWLCYAMQPPI
jgi:hypothetical protein